MADSPVPGLGDLLSLFGGSNPLASIGKTIEQFKRGVSDFLSAVENFNRTMETLNGVAERVTILMDEVEEPIRAFMPQVTRSIKMADTVISQISGPIERVAPGISRLADTLSSPVFATIPNDIASFVDAMSDVAQRMQPLAQMAETAGSMFGLRPLAALRGGSGRPPAAAAPAPPPPPPPTRTPPTVKKAPKKTSTKKTPVTKSPVTKTPAKKTPAKKTPAKKTPAK